MAALARFPDFSDPPPVARRLPDVPPAPLERTHFLVLRDDDTGVRFIAETILGQTFGAVVRDLSGGHVPLGCSLDSVGYTDGESPVADVTERVLTTVLQRCNDLGEDVSASLAPAFERCGIALPAPGEGSIQSDVLTAGRRHAA